MEFALVFLLLGIVGVAIASVVRSVKAKAARRTEAMELTANRRGWAFRPKPDAAAVPQLNQFELFRQGRDRTLTNFMAGDHGDFRIALFDYSYVTGSGKSQKTWRQTVVSAASTALDLPEFSIRPEHVFHRIAELFGSQDIDLDHRPEFSRRYLLRGANEAAVRAAFTTAVADYLEGRERCCAAGARSILFFWRPDRMVKPEEIEVRVAEVEGLALAFARTAHERPPARHRDRTGG